MNRRILHVISGGPKVILDIIICTAGSFVDTVFRASTQRDQISSYYEDLALRVQSTQIRSIYGFCIRSRSCNYGVGYVHFIWVLGPLG